MPYPTCLPTFSSGTFSQLRRSVTSFGWSATDSISHVHQSEANCQISVAFSHMNKDVGLTTENDRTRRTLHEACDEHRSEKLNLHEEDQSQLEHDNGGQHGLATPRIAVEEDGNWEYDCLRQPPGSSP